MPLLFNGTSTRCTTTTALGAPTAYPITTMVLVRLTSAPAHLVDYGLTQIGRTDVTLGGTFYLYGKTGSPQQLQWFRSGAFVDSATFTVPTGVWLLIGYSGASATSHRFFVYNYTTQAIVLNSTAATNVTYTNPTGHFFKVGCYQSAAAPTFSAFTPARFAWAAWYTTDFTVDAGRRFRLTALSGPYAAARPTALWSFYEPAGVVTARNLVQENHLTVTNAAVTAWETTLPLPEWALLQRRRSRLSPEAPPAGAGGARVIGPRYALVGPGGLVA